MVAAALLIVYLAGLIGACGWLLHALRRRQVGARQAAQDTRALVRLMFAAVVFLLLPYACGVLTSGLSAEQAALVLAGFALAFVVATGSRHRRLGARLARLHMTWGEWGGALCGCAIFLGSLTASSWFAGFIVAATGAATVILSMQGLEIRQQGLSGLFAEQRWDEIVAWCWERQGEGWRLYTYDEWGGEMRIDCDADCKRLLDGLLPTEGLSPEVENRTSANGE